MGGGGRHAWLVGRRVLMMFIPIMLFFCRIWSALNQGNWIKKCIDDYADQFLDSSTESSCCTDEEDHNLCRLYLTNCRNLRSVPRLPPNLHYICLRDCSNLESLLEFPRSTFLAI